MCVLDCCHSGSGAVAAGLGATTDKSRDRTDPSPYSDLRSVISESEYGGYTLPLLGHDTVHKYREGGPRTHVITAGASSELVPDMFELEGGRKFGSPFTWALVESNVWRDGLCNTSVLYNDVCLMIDKISVAHFVIRFAVDVN